MNTKNKLGFKYFFPISGMAMSVLLTSACNQLPKYGMDSRQNDQESGTKKSKINSSCTIDSNRDNQLHEAASKGYLEVVKSLLEDKSININEKDVKGKTPLHYAIWENNLEVVKLLLDDKRIKVNEKDGDDWTPLRRASYKGHIEVVKLLLSNPYINVNEQNCRFCLIYS